MNWRAACSTRHRRRFAGALGSWEQALASVAGTSALVMAEQSLAVAAAEQKDEPFQVAVQFVEAVGGCPTNSVSEADSFECWRELTEALAPAAAILLLGHGAGKANASHHWVAYVEKHRTDVAAKVVADVRVDIDHLDDTQVLRLAQYYFAGHPCETSATAAGESRPRRTHKSPPPGPGPASADGRQPTAHLPASAWPPV
jgi:hypothetical protein